MSRKHKAVGIPAPEAMHDEIQRLADEFRITKAEFGRRCLFWGIQNPDIVRDIEVSEP